MKATIKGWIARDKDENVLFLYPEKPIRNENRWDCTAFGLIKCHSIPIDITWEDEPIKITIAIEKE